MHRAGEKSTTDEILLLGDWYVDRPIDAAGVIKDYPYIFNLEAPISEKGQAVPNKICLRMSSNHILESFGRKPIAVCIGNNHIMDFGKTAFVDTTAQLNKMGIPFFGVHELGPRDPMIVPVGGQWLALLSYVCPSTHPIYAQNDETGVFPLEIEQIQHDILAAHQLGATRTIVFLHWGVEEASLPRPEDREIAHRIIDLGADLIVGHHSHAPQAMEIHQGKLIAYGLGNFAMQDNLSVPIYNESHEIITRFKKSLARWNKLSLGVVWHADDMTWSIKHFFFDGHTAIHELPLNKAFSKFLNVEATGSKVYLFRFAFHLRLRKLAYVIQRYRTHPKPLRMRHVIIFFRAILKPPRE